MSNNNNMHSDDEDGHNIGRNHLMMDPIRLHHLDDGVNNEESAEFIKRTMIPSS